jgi:hypothetical protein
MHTFQAFLSSVLSVCMLVWISIIIIYTRTPLLRFLVFCQCTLIAVSYESRYMGCGLYDCEPETNKDSIPSKSFACVESDGGVPKSYRSCFSCSYSGWNRPAFPDTSSFSSLRGLLLQL